MVGVHAKINKIDLECVRKLDCPDFSESMGSSTVILDYASSLLANALNRHYYFVLLGAAKNIDG